MSKAKEKANSREIEYLRAGLEQLKDYLLSKELYWHSGLTTSKDGSAYPQLTLGNLLFSRQVVESLGAESELIKQLDAIHQEWKSAWRTKAEREFDSRLPLWKEYIVYLKQEPHPDWDTYPTEIRQRVLLDLLESEVPELDEDKQHALEIEDQHLDKLVASGDFVWDEALAAAFPQSQYWYLYSQPRGE